MIDTLFVVGDAKSRDKIRPLFDREKVKVVRAGEQLAGFRFKRLVYVAPHGRHPEFYTWLETAERRLAPGCQDNVVVL